MFTLVSTDHMFSESFMDSMTVFLIMIGWIIHNILIADTLSCSLCMLLLIHHSSSCIEKGNCLLFVIINKHLLVHTHKCTVCTRVDLGLWPRLHSKILSVNWTLRVYIQYVATWTLTGPIDYMRTLHRVKLTIRIYCVFYSRIYSGKIIPNYLCLVNSVYQ